MYQIDLGFINKKQLIRIIEEIDLSYLGIIEINIHKMKENMSVILKFRTRREKDSFDKQAGNLIKDLIKLNCPLAWR